MSRAKPTPDVPQSTLEDALHILCKSGAVARLRVPSFANFRVKDMATGQVVGGQGPILILIVNEKLLRQGW